MARIKLEDIVQELAQDSWEVISTTYQNLDSQMEFQCPEGHKVYSSWSKLRSKRECPVCKQNHFKQNTNIIKTKPRGENRILALDQASRITGFSIFDGDQLVSYGIFEATERDEAERFYEIRNWLLSMIANWKIDIIGIEGIQYQQNIGVTTFQTLARLQGVIMELCSELDVPCIICPTNTWRAYCGVKGKTRTDKKKSMQLLVKQWYDVSVSNDIADAVGIGKYTTETHQKKTEIIEWE